MQQSDYGGVVKAFFDLQGRAAGHDGIGGDITADHGLGPNDCPAADGDPGEDGGAIADPDIMADDNISFGCGVPLDGGGFRPGVREGGEGVGGDPVTAVIAAQDDGHLIGNGAEPANDQSGGLVKLADGWLAVGMIANDVILANNMVAGQGLFLFSGKKHDLFPVLNRLDWLGLIDKLGGQEILEQICIAPSQAHANKGDQAQEVGRGKDAGVEQDLERTDVFKGVAKIDDSVATFFKELAKASDGKEAEMGPVKNPIVFIFPPAQEDLQPAFPVDNTAGGDDEIAVWAEQALEGTQGGGRITNMLNDLRHEDRLKEAVLSGVGAELFLGIL